MHHVHVGLGSCHDLEHWLEVDGVAAHGSTAEVFCLAARGSRELVFTGHHPCTNSHNHHCSPTKLASFLTVRLTLKQRHEWIRFPGVSHLEWFYDQISHWRNKAVGCCRQCLSRRRWPTRLQPECCLHPLRTGEGRSCVFLLSPLS